ncbi:MAG: hypothetical protein Q9163_006212, partial [Psora crenata]
DQRRLRVQPPGPNKRSFILPEGGNPSSSFNFGAAGKIHSSRLLSPRALNNSQPLNQLLWHIKKKVSWAWDREKTTREETAPKIDRDRHGAAFRTVRISSQPRPSLLNLRGHSSPPSKPRASAAETIQRLRRARTQSDRLPGGGLARQRHSKMPAKLDIPICSVNTTKIRHLSTSVENLHNIWSGENQSLVPLPGGVCLNFTVTTLTSGQVFSKCAESLEDGKRLENLSWRIWNRATLCGEARPRIDQSRSFTIGSRPKKADLPDLSASVDSLASVESDVGERHETSRPRSATAPLDIKQAPARKEGSITATTRCQDVRITPLRLEKMVESIQERQDPVQPLSPTIIDAVPAVIPSPDITPRPKSPTIQASLRSSDSSASTAPLSSPRSDRSTTQTVGSDTSAELSISHHIVRGFSPNQTSSSYRSHTHLAPVLGPGRSVPHTKHEKPDKGIFILGVSSGEDESSFEEHMPPKPKPSSLSAGLKRPTGGKKQTSFRDEVESRLVNNKSHEDEDVFVSDDEDDSATDDESEDEDDDEWEDDGSESPDSTVNEQPLFQRVDSKPNLVSRRSLLTSLMHEGDRQAAFTHLAHSQPPLRKSKTQSRMDAAHRTGEPAEPGVATTAGSHLKRSKPIPATASNMQTMPIAFSPRTTRRHMLATEMTESLRKAVLFERQQKKATANAVLKRRHTAHDLTHVKEFTEGDDGSRENHSWNDDYPSGAIGDYHQSGW